MAKLILGLSKGRWGMLAGSIILVGILSLSLGQGVGGAILVVISYGVILLDGRIRGSGKIIIAAIGTLSIHHLLAYWNVEIGALPSAGFDSQTFQAQAMDMVSQGKELSFILGSTFYEELLALTYRVFGANLFIGSELSVLSYALSLPVFIRILAIAGVKDFQSSGIWIFGLWPAMALHRVVTVREPFELLLIMIGTWLLCRGEKKASIAWQVFGAAVLVGAALFHQVLYVYAASAVIITVLIRMVSVDVTRYTVYGGMILLALMAVGFAVVTHVPIKAGDNYVAMTEGGLLHAIDWYRSVGAIDGARTLYGVKTNFSTLGNALISMLKVYGSYMFSPLPGRIEVLADWYAFAEVIARGILLFAMASWVFLTAGVQRRLALMILGFYLSLTLLWSFGTISYGQAIRHHVLSNWLGIVAGVAVADLWLRLYRLRRLPKIRGDFG